MIKRRRPLAQAPAISGDRFVFVCGLHRSGTSVLHRVLQQSPEVSGFVDTGVPEDEGQHLQSVFRPAYSYGGPGRFAFDPASQLTEASTSQPDRDRDTLLREWGAYYDTSRRLFIEKSPPNLVRARYLQRLFPGASFVFIVRHPIAVALATEKWAHTTHLELMLHWDVAHTLMLRDLAAIERKLVVRYEDMTSAFPDYVARIARFIGLADFSSDEVMSDQNGRYFARWEKERAIDGDALRSLLGREGGPMAAFGYDVAPPYTLPREKAGARLA